VGFVFCVRDNLRRIIYDTLEYSEKLYASAFYRKYGVSTANDNDVGSSARWITKAPLPCDCISVEERRGKMGMKKKKKKKTRGPALLSGMFSMYSGIREKRVARPSYDYQKLFVADSENRKKFGEGKNMYRKKKKIIASVDLRLVRGKARGSQLMSRMTPSYLDTKNGSLMERFSLSLSFSLSFPYSRCTSTQIN